MGHRHEWLRCHHIQTDQPPWPDGCHKRAVGPLKAPAQQLTGPYGDQDGGCGELMCQTRQPQVTANRRANMADGRANTANKGTTRQLGERTCQQGPDKATIMRRWHADNTGDASDIPATYSSCRIPVTRRTTPSI